MSIHDEVCSKALSRRRLLRYGAAASTLALGPRPWAESTAALQSKKLRNQLYLLITPASNSVLALDTNGAVLVDGARSPELIGAVSQRSQGKPLQALFNTHWHLANSGVNGLVAADKIIAHENTRLWMGTEIWVEWQNTLYPPRPEAERPNVSFYTDSALTLVGETIRYGHLGQAHTDGDIYLHFPNANVLAVGDTLAVDEYPILDYSSGGWIGGLLKANKKLLALCDSETLIVPGKGSVQNREQLQAQHDMLETVLDILADMCRAGMGAEDMIAAKATKEFDAQWGNSDLLIRNAYPGIWGHIRELGGVV